MWNVIATMEFSDWFDCQTPPAKEEMRKLFELLKAKGPQLSRPYADALKGSRFSHMKELRINASRMAIRIAFAFDPTRNAVLLVAGDKRGISEKLFYRKLIQKADNLYDAYISR